MTRFSKATLVATAGLLISAGGQPPSPNQAATPTPDRRFVDLAICLDTSGSMEGLINAARQGIWAIVNDLALAQPTPKLRVALLTFGNDGHNPENGWVLVETGLTEDLDTVSQKLFALTTNGGTELVGRVVQAATQRLEWSEDPNALKLIVVAGNESADQDQEVRYPDACKLAISNGIQINSIYCGNPNDEIAPAWRDVAKLADGQFHSIDHEQPQVAIATPFDAQLGALNVKLNATYVPFGTAGKAGWANQVAQDRNAESCNTTVVAQRVLSKSTSNYCNSMWDLVDACKAQTVKLEEVEDADLPESLRGKTLAEKQKQLEALGKRRATLQKEIQALSKKREVKVAEEMRKRAIDMTNSFDFAVRKAVRSQAAAKGLEIQAPVVVGPEPKPASQPTPVKKDDDC